MKSNLTTLSYFILFVTLTNPILSQTHELGFGGFLYKQEGTLISTYDPGSLTGNVNYASPHKETSGAPGITYSYFHPFYSPSETFSLNGQTGFNFFLYYEKKDDAQNFQGQTIASGSSSGLYAGYQIPLYLTARLLNGASQDNNEGFGFSTGFGYMAYGFIVPYEKGFMLTPTVTAEIKFNSYGIRFDYLFKKFTSNYQSDTGDIPRLTSKFYSVSIFAVIGGD